jgi:hypothetical protein
MKQKEIHQNAVNERVNLIRLTYVFMFLYSKRSSEATELAINTKFEYVLETLSENFPPF